MEILPFLLSVAGAGALAVLLVVLFGAARMSRLGLQSMVVEPVGLTEVPPAQRSILDIGRRWLMPRGFRYVSSSRLRTLVVARGSDWRHCDVYLNETLAVFAIVTQREQPRPHDVTAIEFQSLLPDGRIVSTMNRYRHAIIWLPPEWEVHDDYLPDMDRVLAAHVARIESRGGGAVSDAQRREEIMKSVAESYLDRLVAAGYAVRDGSDVRMPFAKAVPYLACALRGGWRTGRVRWIALDSGIAVAAGSTPGVVQPGVEADLESYRLRRAALATSAGGGKVKWGLVSAIAFVALGALIWDWRFAIFVLVVIAIHEGGHFLAMKSVGYRNLNVFFVPGLGGLATGEKQDASVAQKVFVYLAGPVPGIALATVGFILIANDHLPPLDGMVDFLTVMLVVNLINLLPVTPLDGGRVLEVLLFTRWPTLRFLFALGCALLLLAAGVAYGETAMLVIGILVILSMPSQWRFSQLARAVHRGREALAESEAARRVFSALSGKAFERWSFEQRRAAADELVSELRTPLAGLAGIVAGICLYATCFAAPAVAAWVSSPVVREAAAMLWDLRDAAGEVRREGAEKRPARDWSVELAAAKASSPEKHLAVLVAATQAGDGLRDEPAHRERLSEIRRMADTLPRGVAERGEALLFLEFHEDPTGRERPRVLAALLEEFRGADSDAGVIVRSRIQSALADSMESSPDRLAMLAEARDGLRGRVPPGDAELSQAWNELAKEFAAQGNRQAAELEWVALLAWHEGTPRQPAAQNYGRSIVEASFMTFLVRDNRVAEAEALVRPGMEQILSAEGSKSVSLSMELPKLAFLFWVSVERGDAAGAKGWRDAMEQSFWQRSAARKNPQLGLADLALADLAGDAKAIAAARKLLQELKGRPLMCRNLGSGSLGPGLDARRAQVVDRHGVCPKDAAS